MDRYVVIGNPVSHSKSPLIHTLFAEQTGQLIEYSTLQAEIGNFPAAANDFFAEGGKGANVTVPFKEDAYKLAAQLSPQAQMAGAVNTLTLDDQGELVGHNTDGIGLVIDLLKNHGGILKEKKILVLGAGGATRGIIAPLLAENPAAITIANRTVNKAEALAEIFNDKGVDISGCGFVALGGQKFDWIINATSASLQGEVPAVSAFLLTANTWCYDLAYGKGPTPFCRWAKEAGAEKSLDGLGMLVEQAAESFFLWRGTRPETSEVIKRLKEA